MPKSQQLVPVSHIHPRIIEIQGIKVILDVDLARIYGVTTKALNQAVKRNIERFPPDFAFRLTGRQRHEVVTICDHFRNLKFSSNLPMAFSEHGADMAANVLRSSQAIRMSIEVVRAFSRLRQLAITHREFATRSKRLERKYDKQFRVVFDALRELFDADEKESQKKPIGFHTELEAAR